MIQKRDRNADSDDDETVRPSKRVDDRLASQEDAASSSTSAKTTADAGVSGGGHLSEFFC